LAGGVPDNGANAVFCVGFAAPFFYMGHFFAVEEGF